MEKEIIVQNDDYTPRYPGENLPARRDGDDGFDALARGDAAGIIGTRLKFVKGNYFAGSGDAEQEVELGSQFLACMDHAAWGWCFWMDGQPIDVRVDYIVNMPRIPPRRSLGDLDEASWPIGPDGGPKDPWNPDARVLLISMSTGDQYTFASSSWGGVMALRELSRAYGAERAEHLGEWPIVELASYRRPARNKSFGRIETPLLSIVGWSNIANVVSRRPDEAKREAGQKRGS